MTTMLVKKIGRLVGTIVFWVGWPVLWVLLPRSRRTRLLLVSKEEFLAVQGWIGTGDWDMPGGGLHKGEDVLDGLIREVFEETGVELQPEQITHAFEAQHHRRSLHFMYDCYVCELPKKPSVILQTRELSAFAWLPINSNEAKLSEEFQSALAWWNTRDLLK